MGEEVNEMCHEDKKEKKLKFSKCESADIDTVVHGCQHLSQEKQNSLHSVLSKCPVLFNNQLGAYPEEKIHLDLKNNVVPFCQPHACSVPHNHRAVFKSELD